MAQATYWLGQLETTEDKDLAKRKIQYHNSMLNSFQGKLDHWLQRYQELQEALGLDQTKSKKTGRKKSKKDLLDEDMGFEAKAEALGLPLDPQVPPAFVYWIPDEAVVTTLIERAIERQTDVQSAFQTSPEKEMEC